ncbi:LysR family transcriptional regulator [Ralstonia sp. 25mfcol4.1]|uniref:LysR substrate-binding domain-containing protein n=1 Tax=Ralstonia sp. 25mfcol4.1 TaxID=1761899 RepID=UPI00158748EE
MASPLLTVPEYSWLRTLDAVDRYGSVEAAAAHLGLTVRAVRRHLAALRQRVPDPRPPHRLLDSKAPTRAPVRLLEAARPHLEGLSSILSGDHAPVRERIFVICPVNLASLWLLPRIGDFCRHFPGATLSLSQRPPTTHEHGLVLHITNLPVTTSDVPFLVDYVVAVATPVFIKLRPQVKRVRDHFTYALIEAAEDGPASSTRGWAAFARSMGYSVQDVERPGLDRTCANAVEAARDGRGIALANATEVFRDLNEGRLVALPLSATPPATLYYAIWGGGDPAAAGTLRAWLECEGSAFNSAFRVVLGGGLASARL